MRDRCTSCLILPICIIKRITVRIEETTICKPIRTISRPVKWIAILIRSPSILILNTLHKSIAPLLRIHRIHLTSAMSQAYRTRVANLRSTFFVTTFRSNHDNTIGTTSTIDSGSGSIFQYLHRLDVIRVHQIEVLHYYAVHNIQWIRRSINCRLTTDNNTATISTRLARVREDIYTGSLTTQVIQCTKVLSF